MSKQQIILAITGASGVAYGLRLLQQLLSAGKSVDLMLSAAAQVVIATETELKIPAAAKQQKAYFVDLYGADPNHLRVFGKDQWMAPVASGSHQAYAMVVCPCSAGSLAAIATGSSDNLLERAADVMLKERRQLILVPREMPLSTIHLENMLKLSRMNAVILPASPGFYHKPTKVEDLVDFVVARILDHLDVDHELLPRWGADSND